MSTTKMTLLEVVASRGSFIADKFGKNANQIITEVHSFIEDGDQIDIQDAPALIGSDSTGDKLVPAFRYFQDIAAVNLFTYLVDIATGQQVGREVKGIVESIEDVLAATNATVENKKQLMIRHAVTSVNKPFVFTPFDPQPIQALEATNPPAPQEAEAEEEAEEIEEIEEIEEEPKPKRVDDIQEFSIQPDDDEPIVDEETRLQVLRNSFEKSIELRERALMAARGEEYLDEEDTEEKEGASEPETPLTLPVLSVAPQVIATQTPKEETKEVAEPIGTTSWEAPMIDTKTPEPESPKTEPTPKEESKPLFDAEADLEQELEKQESETNSVLGLPKSKNFRKVALNAVGLLIAVGIVGASIYTYTKSSKQLTEIASHLGTPAEGMRLITIQELSDLKDQLQKALTANETLKRNLEDSVNAKVTEILKEKDSQHAQSLKAEYARGFTEGEGVMSRTRARIAMQNIRHAVVSGQCDVFGRGNRVDKAYPVNFPIQVIYWLVDPSDNQISGVVGISEELASRKDAPITQMRCVAGRADIWPSYSRPERGADGLSKPVNKEGKAVETNSLLSPEGDALKIGGGIKAALGIAPKAEPKHEVKEEVKAIPAQGDKEVKVGGEVAKEPSAGQEKPKELTIPTP